MGGRSFGIDKIENSKNSLWGEKFGSNSDNNGVEMVVLGEV